MNVLGVRKETLASEDSQKPSADGVHDKSHHFRGLIKNDSEHYDLTQSIQLRRSTVNRSRVKPHGYPRTRRGAEKPKILQGIQCEQI
jgi:hypothetical protein